MKKKQKSARSPSTTTTTTTTTDLKALIRNHSLFFDKLIELIPAKFYLASDDPKPWFQGLTKAAKEASKKKTRDNIKQSRRHRLDPQNPSTTLQLLQQTLKQSKPTDEIKTVGDDRSVTYEELRHRLHRRIEELRSNRGEGTRFEKREMRNNKRKRGFEVEEKKSEKSEREIEKEAAEATKGIEFGKVKIGGLEEIEGKKKKRRLSKAKELERAKKLEEAKRDPERGEVVAKKHSWKAAVSRAAGVKVHDDPRLIKQSMHKEKRMREKNVEKWKDRVESREKMREEKQQKRSGNIAERIQQKKMRKIAKREKKLMRPGFEGRKDGYINQD